MASSNLKISATRRSGFTLVEVMISIAIALVLILGISQIFSMAQRTTGAGNSIIATVETVRGVQSTLASDFRSMSDTVGDSPGIVIVSYALPAWRSAADRANDRDADPTTLNDPAGTGSLAPLNYTQVNDRIHRVDKIIFFARDRYARQTGDTPNLTSPMTSGEAMIVLGHAALPNNATLKNWAFNRPQVGAYNNPGDPGSAAVPDDNNLFASDWILSRQVMLLSPAPASTNNYFVANSAGDPLASWASNPSLTNSSPHIPIYASRYDVAGTSIANYRQFINANVTSYKWWEAISGISTSYAFGSNGAPPTVVPTAISSDQRYMVNPFLIKPPSTAAANAAAQRLSAAVAQASPIFVRGCTQFIVEFAGDFVSQDASGNVTASAPDGQIDYTIDPITAVRQIRWYGFPRQSTDEGKAGIVGGKAAFQYGVAPLRDTWLKGAATPPRLERCAPTQATAPNRWPNTTRNGYASSMGATNNLASQAYVCAWGPDTDALQIPRPKMIRIIMAIDDPAGHLNTQQVYEYVFNLP